MHADASPPPRALVRMRVAPLNLPPEFPLRHCIVISIVIHGVTPCSPWETHAGGPCRQEREVAENERPPRTSGTAVEVISSEKERRRLTLP